jgi:hypothetical protein
MPALERLCERQIGSYGVGQDRGLPRFVRALSFSSAWRAQYAAHQFGDSAGSH